MMPRLPGSNHNNLTILIARALLLARSFRVLPAVFVVLAMGLSLAVASEGYSQSRKSSRKSSRIKTEKSKEKLNKEVVGRFEKFEIRVIRPKYFTKKDKFEVGAQFVAIMNESFIYTFMASGILSYHFAENLGVSLSLGAGFTIDKEDKRILFDEFNIRTKIFRTRYNYILDLMYTPLYGKWSYSRNKVIYFDTFLVLGGGVTGIEWKKTDYCNPDQVSSDITDSTVGYPTVNIGLGQRYFVSKSTAIRWDFKASRLFYNVADSECDPSGIIGAGSSSHDSILVQIGLSRFL